MAEPPKKILLVDGYNVIHRLPELRPSLDKGIENARSRLALQISTWSRSHPETECVIVFDGHPPHGGGPVQRLAGIKSIFSGTPHGGDEAIIGFVREREGGRYDITVVSDDNNVRNNCRAYGASVQPSNFISVKKSRPSGARGKFSPADKGLDRRTASEIDKELRKKFGL